jgi:hypothetical protein
VGQGKLTGKRVLVTGSRNWIDKPGVWPAQAPGIIYRNLMSLTEAAVFYVKPTDVTLVHGKCPDSPDMLADTAARQLGWKIEPHPANWDLHGKAAGYIRNQEMVDLGADICLAFMAQCIKSGCAKPKPHFSHGVSHCADAAQRAGIIVWRYEQWLE